MLFLPKTTDTTITELVIENMVRASVFATAIIPREDLRHFGGAKAAAGAAGARQSRQRAFGCRRHALAAVRASVRVLAAVAAPAASAQP